jgi:hypothetical protein
LAAAEKSYNENVTAKNHAYNGKPIDEQKGDALKAENVHAEEAKYNDKSEARYVDKTLIEPAKEKSCQSSTNKTTNEPRPTAIPFKSLTRRSE